MVHHIPSKVIMTKYCKKYRTSIRSDSEYVVTYNIMLRWVAPNYFLQLPRFLRSLGGFTNTGGSPKCFTHLHAPWFWYMTKHQRMAQVGTWKQFSILGGWCGRRHYNIVMTSGSEPEIDWCIDFVLFAKDIAITIVLFITILQNKWNVSCLSR